MGAEAAGLGVDTEHHAATLTKGRPGVLHGSLMDVLQDAHGQILEAFSISAGLDYPGIGPEHSHYHDIKRASYVPVTDEEALEGFQLLSRVEGIIPALESSHAIAFAGEIGQRTWSRQVYDCLPIWSWGQGCGSSQRPLGSRCSKEGRSPCLRH